MEVAKGLHPAVLLLVVAMVDCVSADSRDVSLPHISYSSQDNYTVTPKLRRQKRLLYFTTDRRLTFPPGTGLFLTPTFSLPFIRNMPTGYDTGMTISLPFKLDFDVLGWADETNPFGLFPDFGLFRRRRGLDLHSLGSTPAVYGAVTEVLDNLGYPGAVCLRRAVCEMRAGPLADSYGWLKDLLEWALTPSLNSKSRRGIEEYYEAEQLGRAHDCSRYLECSFSIFTDASSRHRSEAPKRKLHAGAPLSNSIHSSEEQPQEEQNILLKPDTKPLKSDSKLLKYESKLDKSDSKLLKYDSKLHKYDKVHKTDSKLLKSESKSPKSDHKLYKPDSDVLKLSRENITVESLAHETKMKKTMKKIQAIAMLQSFKKVIR